MVSLEKRQMIFQSIQADNGFLGEFVEDFLVELPSDMQSLKDAILLQDAAGLESAAHSLKSVVGLFKAMEAYELSKDIEQLAREADFVAAAEKYKDLESALKDLGNLLTEMLKS